MALLCTQLCLFCKEPQLVKINFILVHGVCRAHIESLSETVANCIHCKSVAPINKITEQKACKYCVKPAFQGLYQCGHSFCLNCTTDSYTCTLCENSNQTCDYCEKSAILTNLACSHQLCQQCLKQSTGCYLCESLCINCQLNKNTIKLKCNHKICSTCMSTSKVCKVCPETCNACEVDIIWNELGCLHKICETCEARASGCPLCKETLRPKVKNTTGTQRSCLECLIF